MKSMFYKSIATAFVLLIGISIVGCSQESEREFDLLQQSGITFCIKVGDEGVEKSTFKAATDPSDPELKEESKIDELWMFIASGDDNSEFILAEKCSNKEGTNTYLVPVSEAQKSQLNGKKTTFFVANYKFDRDHLPQNINALKSVVSETANLNKGAMGPIPMVVRKDDIIYNYPNEKNLGNIQLKRILAKIKVDPINFEVKDYSIEKAEYALLNYRTKGYLGKIEAAGSPVSMTDAEYTTSDRLYSYFHKWGDKPEEEPILMIKATVKRNNSSQTPLTLYYRVPIEASGDQLNTNYVYKIRVTIKQLGSEIPADAVEIGNSEVNIEQWEVVAGKGDLNNGRYLFFYEHEVEVYTQNIKIGYATSSELVKDNGAELKPVYIKYVRKNPKRDQDEEFDVAEEDQPQNVSAENGILSFSSTIPDNGMRKVMKFRIENIQGYSDEITIIQLPYTLVEQYYVEEVLEPKREKNDPTSIAYMIRPLLLKTSGMKVKLIDNNVEKNTEIPFYYRFPKRKKELLYRARVVKKLEDNPDNMGPCYITDFDDDNESNISPAFYVQSQYGEMGPYEYKGYGTGDRDNYIGVWFNRVGRKDGSTWWYETDPKGRNRACNYLRHEEMKFAMRLAGHYRQHNNAMLLCDLHWEKLAEKGKLGKTIENEDDGRSEAGQPHQIFSSFLR